MVINMNYRTDKYGNRISVLGYGCMRFTQNGGKIDLDKAEREILEAYHAGVNYFDTAYIYAGSEDALGKILEKNQIRDKVSIATKLPHYLIKKADSMEKYFTEQLKRLRTDYVDYYLMHMLTDVKTWDKLKELGILEWLSEKKKSGAIRQVGFSYHGNSDMFCELIDAYDWDFCQIQYNYLDEHSQAGRKGLMYAASKKIPVIIMEPLRGGKLVGLLPDEAKRLFDEYPIKRSPAEWAFRWLWNQPEVTCVLSGMNSLEMVQENVRTAAQVQVGEFTEAEEKLLRDVVQAINAKVKVGCTGCRYCMPCPKNVDIPGTFAAYNRRYTDGKRAAVIEYVMCTALRKDSSAASNCIECGKCETHCPQHIEIRQELKNARKELEGPLYRIARKVVQLLKLY
ncbi:MAG: aldo/keto reductase [Bacillus sp. (in: Bacteria)]|nr:aldo/keto reductase [Bacillus sp. (in: firmicutes)]